MKDWKIKQELYHRLNVVHEDDLSKVNIQKTNNVVDDAIKYFNERDVGWIYPSKSYVVAICYAWWLSHDFQEDFADLLNDKDLLYGNDPYFKPYSEDTDTYNAIIDKVLPLNETKGMVPDIKKWYTAEFML
tara:strand:+ start:287 stop:679 length:393 start_codon:yes stop_codon:yes gene_type:complete